MAVMEPIRDKDDMELMSNQLRDIDEKYYIMFWLGVYTGLRVGDLLRIRVVQVRGKDTLRLTEQKTQKERRIPLTNPRLRRMLSEYCRGRKDAEFLIPAKNCRPMSAPCSRVQAWRAMRRAAEQIGLEHIGTHTMRKTFGLFIYQQNHKDVGLVQAMLNHSAPSITLRYIGVNSLQIDDAYENLKF